MEHENPKIKGFLKDEQIQFFFRMHWVRLFRPFVFGLVVGVFIFIVLMFLGGVIAQIELIFLRSLYVFFIMIVSVIYIFIFFSQIINYFLHVVVVSDYRVLIYRKTVFLRNDNDAIDLTKIQDIGVEAHGILRNYLNYGSLIITLSTSVPPVRIYYVPDPHYYLEWCNRVKRDYIFRRRDARRTFDDDEDREGYLQDVHSI